MHSRLLHLCTLLVIVAYALCVLQVCSGDFALTALIYPLIGLGVVTLLVLVSVQASRHASQANRLIGMGSRCADRVQDHIDGIEIKVRIVIAFYQVRKALHYTSSAVTH